MTTVKAMAATGKGAAFEAFEYELGELGPHEVDIAVTHCGICHSDLSMRDDAWGMAQFPLVPGHEAAGTVVAKGELVSHLELGQRVGVGWQAGSCMHCRHCIGGDHNLCAEMQGVIVGRHGGFADRVRCHADFAVALPEGVKSESAGPLFCGGITVFNPIVQFGVQPTHRVGVIGIGGLGHMALGFLNKWGCEVTAFTSSGAKMEEAKELGAHRCVNSRDDAAIEAEAGRHDFIISTVNVPLNWEAYIGALSPRGRLHIVGAVLEPIPVPAFPMMFGQRSISGSPIGSPATIAEMLAFCDRHDIAPAVETFKMSQVNDAFERLESGKARYRIVLEQDLS